MKRLKQRCPIAAVLLAVPLSVATAWATPQFSGETRQGSRPPDSDVTATYAMGEVSAIDPSGSRLVVAAGSGQVTVQLDGRTEFLRLAPGETTLEKAEPITLAEVGAGDRVLARGKVSADRKSVAARQLIVMSRADIARKQEREREEWRRRSVAGTITAIDSARREITLQVRTPAGPGSMVVAVSGEATLRRYAPDSVRFADALASSFAELKAGNLLRALGERSADGARLQAEQIVFGSFVMVGGPVVSADAAAGEIRIDNIPTGKPLTVVLSQYSALRRIPPEVAALMALRAQRGGRSASGAGPLREDAVPPPDGAGSPGGRVGQSGAQQRGQAGENLPAGAGPGARFGRGGAQQPGEPAGEPAGGRRGLPGGGDLQDLVERLPAISVADLKPGDWILASATAGADPSRVTAILLAAGIEPLLALPRGMEGSAPGASLGLPGGVLDFEIGLPE